ncbi:MAG: phosphotransferase, partial [Chloroflexota bacterium]
LMTDYGGQALNEIKTLDKWERAISEYSKLQVQLVAHTSTLQKLGIPQRPLSWIESHLNAFLLNLDTYVEGWNKARKKRLHDSIPFLHRLLAQLSENNIPNTLEHGDFWAGQIIVRRDKTLFTDWSDSTLTHPFFSLPFFLVDIQHELPNVPLETIQQTLTTAYLDAWTDYMPLADLQSAMQSASIISPLFTALRYHVDILPRMENKWEMINMVGYNLGLLLKALDSA